MRIDIPDFWALDRTDALQLECDIVREMTPMIVLDLSQLASQYETVICEGDIDIDQIIIVVTNKVTITNHGEKYDFLIVPNRKNA